MKHAILIIAFAFTNVFGFSQENALEETIKKQIGYNDEDFFSFELKTILEIPNTVVALAVKYQEKNEEEQYFTADLYLYLINTINKSIISTYVEKEKFTSDAVILEQVTFNSVPYMTNASVGTFGIKSISSTHSRIFNYSNTLMSLYHVNNGYICLILKEFEIGLTQGEGNADCNYEYEETNSVLKIDTKKTNGFYNLKVISNKEIFKSVAPKNEKDDCIETTKKLKPVTKVLTFRKEKYSFD